ncbi:hypothetical protein CYMTET_21183 [Cymbomonas tetramitiformis]|uniref:Uncharacterized protein n=1 Tax=Cymbomonas tetramitiformis TaxID=36881 RepID=A0AAE0L351_9CHLO|nr:hypothetical protein CYMTET_21183 [Cymbomonas tetramitiformis]
MALAKLKRTKTFQATNPVADAIAEDDLQILISWIEEGADVNAVDTRGLAPLHWACRYGSAQMAAYLIDSGADVSALASSGSMSPLMLAILPNSCDAGICYPEVVKLLLERGAPATAAPEPRGLTALHLAAIAGHPNIVNLLVKHGAAVNAQAGQQQSGYSPLHLAFVHGHEKVVEELISLGADTNQKDHHGRTPIQVGQDVTNRNEIQTKRDLIEKTELRLQSTPSVHEMARKASLADQLAEKDGIAQRPRTPSGNKIAFRVAAKVAKGFGIAVGQDKEDPASSPSPKAEKSKTKSKLKSMLPTFKSKKPLADYKDALEHLEENKKRVASSRTSLEGKVLSLRKTISLDPKKMKAHDGTFEIVDGQDGEELGRDAAEGKKLTEEATGPDVPREVAVHKLPSHVGSVTSQGGSAADKRTQFHKKHITHREPEEGSNDLRSNAAASTRESSVADAPDREASTVSTPDEASSAPKRPPEPAPRSPQNVCQGPSEQPTVQSQGGLRGAPKGAMSPAAQRALFAKKQPAPEKPAEESEQPAPEKPAEESEQAQRVAQRVEYTSNKASAPAGASTAANDEVPDMQHRTARTHKSGVRFEEPPSTPRAGVDPALGSIAAKRATFSAHKSKSEGLVASQRQRESDDPTSIRSQDASRGHADATEHAPSSAEVAPMPSTLSQMRKFEELAARQEARPTKGIMKQKSLFFSSAPVQPNEVKPSGEKVKAIDHAGRAAALTLEVQELKRQLKVKEEEASWREATHSREVRELKELNEQLKAKEVAKSPQTLTLTRELDDLREQQRQEEVTRIAARRRESFLERELEGLQKELKAAHSDQEGHGDVAKGAAGSQQPSRPTSKQMWVNLHKVEKELEATKLDLDIKNQELVRLRRSRSSQITSSQEYQALQAELAELKVLRVKNQRRESLQNLKQLQNNPAGKWRTLERNVQELQEMKNRLAIQLEECVALKKSLTQATSRASGETPETRMMKESLSQMLVGSQGAAALKQMVSRKSSEVIELEMDAMAELNHMFREQVQEANSMHLLDLESLPGAQMGAASQAVDTAMLPESTSEPSDLKEAKVLIATLQKDQRDRSEQLEALRRRLETQREGAVAADEEAGAIEDAIEELGSLREELYFRHNSLALAGQAGGQGMEKNITVMANQMTALHCAEKVLRRTMHRKKNENLDAEAAQKHAAELQALEQQLDEQHAAGEELKRQLDEQLVARKEMEQQLPMETSSHEATAMGAKDEELEELKQTLTVETSSHEATVSKLMSSEKARQERDAEVEALQQQLATQAEELGALRGKVKEEADTREAAAAQQEQGAKDEQLEELKQTLTVETSSHEATVSKLMSSEKARQERDAEVEALQQQLATQAEELGALRGKVKEEADTREAATTTMDSEECPIDRAIENERELELVHKLHEATQALTPLQEELAVQQSYAETLQAQLKVEMEAAAVTSVLEQQLIMKRREVDKLKAQVEMQMSELAKLHSQATDSPRIPMPRRRAVTMSLDSDQAFRTAVKEQAAEIAALKLQLSRSADLATGSLEGTPTATSRASASPLAAASPEEDTAQCLENEHRQLLKQELLHCLITQSQMQGWLDALEGPAAGVKAQAPTPRNAMTQMEEKLEELQASGGGIEALECEVDSCNAENEQLLQQLLKKKMHGALDAGEGVDGSNECLKPECVVLRGERDGYREALEEETEVVELCQKENETLNQELETSSAELKVAKNEIKQVQQRLPTWNSAQGGGASDEELAAAKQEVSELKVQLAAESSRRATMSSEMAELKLQLEEEVSQRESVANGQLAAATQEMAELKLQLEEEVSRRESVANGQLAAATQEMAELKLQLEEEVSQRESVANSQLAAATQEMAELKLQLEEEVSRREDIMEEHAHLEEIAAAKAEMVLGELQRAENAKQEMLVETEELREQLTADVQAASRKSSVLEEQLELMAQARQTDEASAGQTAQEATTLCMEEPQEAERLRGQLQALQAELGAVKARLAAASEEEQCARGQLAEDAQRARDMEAEARAARAQLQEIQATAKRQEKLMAQADRDMVRLQNEMEALRRLQWAELAQAQAAHESLSGEVCRGQEELAEARLQHASELSVLRKAQAAADPEHLKERMLDFRLQAATKAASAAEVKANADAQVAMWQLRVTDPAWNASRLPPPRSPTRQHAPAPAGVTPHDTTDRVHRELMEYSATLSHIDEHMRRKDLLRHEREMAVNTVQIAASRQDHLEDMRDLYGKRAINGLEVDKATIRLLGEMVVAREDFLPQLGDASELVLRMASPACPPDDIGAPDVTKQPTSSSKGEAAEDGAQAHSFRTIVKKLAPKLQSNTDPQTTTKPARAREGKPRMSPENKRMAQEHRHPEAISSNQGKDPAVPEAQPIQSEGPAGPIIRPVEVVDAPIEVETKQLRILTKPQQLEDTDTAASSPTWATLHEQLTTPTHDARKGKKPPRKSTLNRQLLNTANRSRSSTLAAIVNYNSRYSQVGDRLLGKMAQLSDVPYLDPDHLSPDKF